jgi:hypothetical protein
MFLPPSDVPVARLDLASHEQVHRCDVLPDGHAHDSGAIKSLPMRRMGYQFEA